MPQEVKEIDALKQEVLREHINTLKQITPPKESTGAFTLDRGYLDENNEATPLGAQYLLLRDNGLMDENGELTDEGRVYAKTQKEAVYGSPDDYIKREKLGLNQLDKDATKVGFGDSMLSMGKQFVTESIPAMFRFMSPTASLDPLQQINDASTLVKSSWLSLEPLATGAVNKVADLSLALSNADADEKETASLLLKQEYERKRYDYDSITGADFLTALSGGSTVPNQMRDILIKQKGEEYVTEQEQAIGLVGSFVDPSVPASMGSTLIAKSVGQTMMRSLLNAEKQALRFSVLSTEQAGIRSQMAALESALSRAEGVGAKVTEKASALESIGKTAESARYKATATRIGDSMQDIKGKLDELAVADSKISTDLAGLSKKAGIGDALIGINNKIQQFNALPANVVGQTVEVIGNGLMKADAWLDDIATRTGIDGVYNTLKSIPGLSAGLVLGPAAAVPTIGARILASGPFLESVGKYTKILGKELMQARGSSSYWQRVANNPTISNAQRFLSHRMDELTLGGYLPELGANVAKGTAASYPMNLAIEYLQDPYGDTKDILSRAGGVSLVFGGGFSGVTQMFKGSKETLKSVRIADELNFTRNLLESQKAGFNSLGKGSRRMVSSFAAAFPNLNWDFVDGLPSRYDPVTNTVRINPKSNNPLRPLIAHEVGHYISIRNGANPLIHSMLLGDAETPGILRKTNGELDPEFQRFKDEYDRRTDAGNIERRSLEAIAEEYFIENTVDHMVEMVESGELSKMTGRTQAGRQLRKFIQATMPRVPILKDFFFRTGGAMQAGGKFVEGNGLLAEGLRELPEAKAMMRNLIRDTAGEASLVPRGKGEKGDAGNRLPVQKGDPIVDSFHSVLESDANGQPLLDKDGDHIPLSKATDEARQAAGLVLIEEQIRRVNDGYMPEDGEIKLIPDQGWQGRFISPATINALAAKGILNAKQIAILRNINTATRQNSGTRYMVINHPATIKRRGGKIRYASLEATLRETVPVGFSITKTGNILVHLMSVDQLHKNVTSRAASKRGQALYQGNTEAIKKDISAMMDMHATNTKTDKYYQDKYGPKWEEYQQFINTIFGQMTKEQRSINPMFDADKIKDGNVYRTFRLDRISKATKMDGTPIPFNYDYVKVNYFPDGVVEKSEQMPEQMRRMPENVSPEDLTPVDNRVEAQRLFAEGKRMFAINEMDDLATEITSLEMLNSYPPDSIGYVDAGDRSSARYMPEGAYDRETAIQNKQIIADRFENFRPQVGVQGLTYGWQRPSDGKFIKIDQHHFLYRNENGQQLGDPSAIGYVRIAREGNTLFYDGKPNSKQLKELKDTAIENNLDLQNSTPRYMPEKIDADNKNIEISNAVDEYGDVDYDAYDAVNKIAKNRDLGITSDRELSKVAKDKSGKIVGGAFTSIDENTYSFDVVVSKEAEGKGVGSRLLDSVIKPDPELFEVYPDMKVSVDVVNPSMKKMLESRGFKVDKQIDKTRWIMSPSDKSKPDSTPRYMPEKITTIPESEGGNLKPATWDTLEKVGYNPAASEKTQITTTASTYEKIVNANAKKGMRVLDFSAGRGAGTASIKQIGKLKGFEVSGYEPYSNPKTRIIAPEYEGIDSLAKIPDNSYDLIINNAVLNVVPEDVGRGIVRDIYSKLAPEGSAFINVMGWNNIKGRLDNPKTKLVGPREVITQKGTFQKGYTNETLKSLIESEIPDAKIVRTNYGDIGFKITKPPIKIIKEEISMPAGIPNIPSENKRFLPEPVEKLSAFIGKRVQVLTSDLSTVKDIKYGDYTAKFTGGPGYLDNDGWGFTSKDAAEAFITRWEKDGKPLIGLASLGPQNHLNSLDSRKAYGEKWKSLVTSKVLTESESSNHIQEAMDRIIQSDAKSVKSDWKEVASRIKTANDLAEYFDKIPWAASPMFYEKLTAKTLPISHKRLVEYGLDLESVSNEFRQAEFNKAELGDLFAIAEYNGSRPEYKPELNSAYPWQIKFSKRAVLSEMHNVADLTTDPRAFAGKKVGGRLGAQPLMVTGINLDKLMSGELKESGKPLKLLPETPKTKSNLAKEFGTGNPSRYQPYVEKKSKPKAKKSKSTSKIKISPKSISDVAKMK